MLRIPLTDIKEHQDHEESNTNIIETFYVSTQFKNKSSQQLNGTMHATETSLFRITMQSQSPNKEKGYIMKHKRLKALHKTSQPIPSMKYSSLLTQQDDTDEARIKSRQASRGYIDNAKFLSLEDEIMFKDDDDLEINARDIAPEEPKSLQAYNTIYKAIDRIQEKKQFYNQSNKTIYSSMASLTGQLPSQTIDSFKLLPRKFGIIGTSVARLKKDLTLNAGHYSLGDRYAKVLGAGLASEPMKNLKSIALQNNRLTALGIHELAKQLPKRVNSLNLQGNIAGRVKGQEQQILQNFNRIFLNIVDLNLENNKFYDEGAKILLKELATNKHIRKLNLSQNYISDNCSQDIYDMLISNKSIVELYLHWNWLHGNSGKQIAAALMQNDVLKILDLSHNSIGVPKINQSKTIKQITKGSSSESQFDGLSCAAAWGELLSANESSCLVHLDLSYNQFTQDDTKLIASKIENNHSLYGFHFRGNGDPSTKIDHQGFLSSNEQEKEVKEIHSKFIIKGDQNHAYIPGILKHRRINGAQALTIPKDDQQDENCWLCGGWTEINIIWNPTALELHSEPIFVHFSHERYVPVQMIKVDENNANTGPTLMSKKFNHVEYMWNVKRMVPSHQPIKFFFSSPSNRASAFSRQYEQVEWSESEKKKRVVFYTMDGKIIKFKRSRRANIIIAEQKPILTDKQYAYPLIESVPRVKDIGGILKYQLEGGQEEEEEEEDKIIEDFFRDCPRDSDELFVKCFEFDWAKSSITKIVKNPDEQARVKQYLKSIYKDLVTAYRQISAYSPCGEYWSISLNCYTDFFSHILVDNSKYGLKDMDIIFKQCTSRHNNITRLQTQLALIRFQFMEIIVRLAIDKYFNNGLSSSIHEAIQRLYEQDGLSQKVELVQDPQEWRDTMYWTPQCNKVATESSIILAQLFTLTVSFRSLNYFTTNKFITPSAFRELMQRAKLVDDQNVERNVNQGYSLSVQLVIDEVGSERHMQMNFKEFTEALCRVSERMTNIASKIEGETKQDQLAFRFQGLINLLASKYNIQSIEDKAKKSSREMQKREGPDLIRNSFVKQVANKLVFESEDTPMNSQPPQRQVNLSNFSSAILNL